MGGKLWKGGETGGYRNGGEEGFHGRMFLVVGLGTGYGGWKGRIEI